MADQLTPEQVVRRVCATIERCDRAMNDEFLGHMPEVPLLLRRRMMHAINHLRDRLIQKGID